MVILSQAIHPQLAPVLETASSRAEFPESATVVPTMHVKYES